MARRRSMNVFSLSFLDAITCGFGAIILFYMIIVANIDLRHDLVVEDVSGEVDRVEMRMMAGRKNLIALQQELASLIEEQAVLRGVRSQLSGEIAATERQFSELTEVSTARQQTVEELEAELEELRAEIERASAQSVTPEEAGDRIRSVTGEGNRQYLTGLRMGGERIVILVDASTSMLDRTLVNVIRRRNMSEEEQRQAPKWQQTVDTVDWLTAQIQPNTQFQIYAFNDKAWSLVEGTDGRWLTATDGSQLEQAVETLRATAPSGPTSLHAAFIAARELEPKPDNIYLIADGLPTMGTVMPPRAGVTSRERVDHFQRAARELPLNVPVNVILLAMEGDPMAAPSFWWLALNTGGSMLAPAEDWP
ncbi:MAG: VWA domain-containing protein [Gammaproteobacteria bacterium]|nr:VWA domain-containing protein [Gammaproteobacteria bacterium]